MKDEELKVPPHSIEAEQSVLGALLLDNQAWERVADIITAADFYKGNHRKIYETIENVITKNPPADMVTVAEALAAAGVLEQCGGAAYLASMAQTVPSALNIRRYAEMVREKALLRSVIRISGEIMEKGFNPAADPMAVMEEAEQRIFELRQKRTIRTAREFRQLVTKVYDSIDTRFHSSHEITGLRTGFGKLDEMTAGLQGGDLIIVAGRPSMGKTAFAMNVAEYVGLETKKPVAVFSLEMADEQLVQRMMGSVGRVDQHKLRTGRLTNEDWSALTGAVERLHEAPFFVEETAGLSITELRARARRIAHENPGLGLIVVDYLQLMVIDNREGKSRVEQVGEISRGLKALAKELGIPVVALSQLSRAVENRIDKVPVMSDLRDSGNLEQDADVVLFIYRDQVYHDSSSEWGYARIIIGKQRNGPIGKVYLKFVEQETRFENADGWLPPKKEKRAKKGFVAKAEEEAAARAEAHAD